VDIWMNVNKYPVSTSFIDALVKEDSMTSPKEEWLKEVKDTVRYRYSQRLDEFLEWVKKRQSS
jgi:hypothetical protein